MFELRPGDLLTFNACHAESVDQILREAEWHSFWYIERLALRGCRVSEGDPDSD